MFTPKYRKKALFGQIRRHLGTVFRELAQRKECKIEEGHLMPDHVHMLISIPPKYSVAEVIGYLKGKSSIWIAQNVERKLRNFLGHKFWARGYFVSTVGRDEKTSSRPHKVPSLVPESFITASGGSPPNPQLCWGLLAHLGATERSLFRAREHVDRHRLDLLRLEGFLECRHDAATALGDRF